MMPFRFLTAGLIFAFVLGCAELTPIPSGKIVFETSTEEIEISRGEKVELEWIDVIGENMGGAIRTTAQLSDDGVIIETASDMNGKYSVSTRTIPFDKLPETWGIGKIYIKNAQ